MISAFLMLCLRALAADPAVPELSDEEWATLRGRDVVLRTETSSQEVKSTGMVLVDLAPEALWPEIFDFRARMSEMSTLKDIREYRRESPTVWYMRSDLRLFGYTVSFNNRFVWDRAGSWAKYTLDASQPNDLVQCEGWYLVKQVEGKSLLVYYSMSESKIYVPGWARRRLANDSMRNLLKKLRDRAERRR